MATVQLTDDDTRRARQIWDDYQEKHDVSGRLGQAVGIDPFTGRVWFGQSIVDIASQLEKENLDIPLYFVRVGQTYYYRKGGHR